MDQFFKTLFGKSVSTGLASILFFLTPSWEIIGNKIIISGELRGIFTPKVRRILNTSTQITVTYRVALKLYQDDDKKLMRKEKKHTIQYDSLSGEYNITIDEKEKVFKKREEAFNYFKHYQVTIQSPYKGEFTCDLLVDATIQYKSKLQVDFKGSALWDHYIPNIKMEGIEMEVSE